MLAILLRIGSEHIIFCCDTFTPNLSLWRHGTLLGVWSAPLPLCPTIKPRAWRWRWPSYGSNILGPARIQLHSSSHGPRFSLPPGP